MELEFKKTDKKIMEIIARLYLRHYNLADIFDYINGKDLLQIFSKRLDEHIQVISKEITDTYNVTKEEFIKIIEKNDKKGAAILKFKINDLIKRYVIKQKNSKKMIKDLENDIKELEEFLKQDRRIVHFSENEKNNCMLYQVLKNKSYTKLKKVELDI